MSTEKANILDAINARIAVMAGESKKITILPNEGEIERFRQELRALFDELEMQNLAAVQEEIEAAEQRAQEFGAFS